MSKREFFRKMLKFEGNPRLIMILFESLLVVWGENTCSISPNLIVNYNCVRNVFWTGLSLRFTGTDFVIFYYPHTDQFLITINNC
jgi:hypothetical protein